MPRLVHRDTGVVVNVSDERAANMPAEWQAEADKPAKAPAKKSSAKK